jgi:hypothetical protein
MANCDAKYLFKVFSEIFLDGQKCHFKFGKAASEKLRCHLATSGDLTSRVSFPSWEFD